MKLTRLNAEPGPVLEFVEESLERLGAVCERTWHDRLEVVAEGTPGRLWREDGGLHEVELEFPEVNAGGLRDPSRQVFVGGPLLFRLVELLWQAKAADARLCLAAPLGGDRPPAAAVVEKLWLNQFGQAARVAAEKWEAGWHFSVVVTVRCEVQAIDQSWSCHRVAVALADGERDATLESDLDLLEGRPAPDGLVWPTTWPAEWPHWLERALREDLAVELAEVRRRQERFLARELVRVDEYFTHYIGELTVRIGRTRTAEARQRYADRRRAATAEHERRRTDQIQRHEIRVIPHLDARLWVAEPAWRTAVVGRHGEALGRRDFVPRTRRWCRAGD